MRPWDVAVQLGHTDGGQLVMQRYGRSTDAGARAGLLAASITVTLKVGGSTHVTIVQALP